MDKRKKLEPGNEVIFNTNRFNDIGFYERTIYEVEKVIDNVRVTLKGYENHLISKKYLVKIAKMEK